MSECYLMATNIVRQKVFGGRPQIISEMIHKVSYQTHTEFRFGNYNRRSFSGEFGFGARFKNIEYTHTHRWDGLLLPYTDEQEREGYQMALSMDGMEYDTFGVLGQATDFDIIKPNPDKIWCSKTTARIMFAADPEFKDFMNKWEFDENVNPEQLWIMACHYYRTWK